VSSRAITGRGRVKGSEHTSGMYTASRDTAREIGPTITTMGATKVEWKPAELTRKSCKPGELTRQGSWQDSSTVSQINAPGNSRKEAFTCEWSKTCMHQAATNLSSICKHLQYPSDAITNMAFHIVGLTWGLTQHLTEQCSTMRLQHRLGGTNPPIGLLPKSGF
jgi:hypothetical protein